MACFTAEVASTFFALSSRTISPLLFSTTRRITCHSKFLTYSSFRLLLSNPTRPVAARRFTVSATTTAPPQTYDDSSGVSTVIPPDNRIPATIITGFLGSGKTTLLNHILTAEHGKKIAVIENEFGEVDIDGSLVASKSAGAEDIMMLNNGCLCCTVRGDLVRMISDLVTKKKGKFDHIVIETTGLANPAPIIQTFYAEESIFNDVKLDGVVTLVDAKHATLHLDEVKPKGVVNEAVEQIAYADRIIVNKTDLVGESDIASLVQRIRKINSMANLKRTEFGKVNLDYVLGIGGFDLERIESAVNDEGAKEDHDHNHDHNHEHHDHDHDHNHEHHDHDHDHKHEHHHAHTHDPGVSSVSIVCEGSLDLEKANMWLGTLLLDRSEDIYRMKGLLSINEMDERFVFQGVHDIFQGSPERLWGADESRINKIVFIGKNLDAQELEKGFKACLL
ncbi:putative cobalamin (vitamin B12) biosynthesis CobW [Lupinus albus]|uniref:Putative cobalamin (Vitamin B12) biosynthesis CobW n=1 Tax=Lupinus albus TaxID=3870 RepID=A0A6A4QW10_LUPAL|nr:putative cobalamin (vitamin B12) biosynthesis CobW [Lupinus albus]